MTALVDRPLDELSAAPLGEPDDVDLDAEAGGDEDERRLRAGMVALSSALSGGAAAWMFGGLLHGGIVPRLIAALGVAIGVGFVLLSSRLTRPAVLQYAVVPAAAFAGAVLVAPEAGGGTANLPGLVGEALRNGGLLQPPVPFDPGWRFILVTFFAILGAGSLGLALATRRAKLAVLVPLPVVFGAALLQPSGSEIVSSSVAIFLLVGALAVAYGAELAADADASTGRFEVRRLGRGAGMLLVLVAAIVGLAQTDFLFPDTNEDRVIPPQKPPVTPLEKDRELFRMSWERPGPVRLGVLDVYDGEAWLLPPQDDKRVVELVDGRIPDATSTAPGTQTAAFSIVDMRGRALPVPPGTTALGDIGGNVEYDPRVEIPRLQRRIPAGTEYTATVRPFPLGSDLNSTKPVSSVAMDEFIVMPPPPAAVLDLLAAMPPGLFDRVQFVRDRLYANVVAAGQGSPVDITPGRVAELIGEPGVEATPFEITAAEAMLVRWAGVPARIGFGYHGGDAFPGGFSFRPKHGAAWLEAYFDGYGWVPLVGTPPQAKSSLSEAEKRDDPRVKPSTNLALRVVIPTQRTTLVYFFELVRYWVLVLLPLVLAAVALVVSFPGVLKAVRASRRRRWGRAQGPVGRILVGYCELRDHCHDLNLGDIRDTPLEFRRTFHDDAEHAELAWLVTRALWGDLRRDLREDDADAADSLLRSLRRRIDQTQRPFNRAVGWSSRASLRDPWSDLPPNFTPGPRLVDRVRGVGRAVTSVAKRLRRLVPVPQGAAVLLAVVFLFGGCASQAGFAGASAPATYPERVAPEPPADLLGFSFVREAEAEAQFGQRPEDLVTEGRLLTIRDANLIQGSLQVAIFRSELDARDRDVQRRVEEAIGGSFATEMFGTVRLRVRRAVEQDYYLWFPPERNVMELFVMQRGFVGRDVLVRAVIAYQRGLAPRAVLSSEQLGRLRGATANEVATSPTPDRSVG